MKYNLYIVLFLLVQYLYPYLYPYPYTISLPTSESQPGDVLIATISASGETNLTVSAPGLIVGTPVFINGDTWKVAITVPDTVIRAKVYSVSLLVDNQVKSTAHLRVVGYALYLPIMYNQRN